MDEFLGAFGCCFDSLLDRVGQLEDSLDPADDFVLFLIWW